MRVRRILALACGVGMAPGLLDAAVLQGTSAARNIDAELQTADSLRVAGDLRAARRLAESLEDRHRNDPRVLMLLGRIHLAWPVVGRFQAESLLARAAKIDSTNPEPCYYIADVGAALGGPDGEEVTHAGLLCALQRNPDYRDSWSRWISVYRNDDRRREMVAALGRYPGSVTASYRRGQLLVELTDSARSVITLESALARRPGDPGIMAWLARALFLAGRDDSAAAVYSRAIDLAERDTAGILWLQVRGISSPEERERFERLPPAGRTAFYRFFWARRNSELAAAVNSRVGEHFRRLAYALRNYSLLHPHARYFRSARYRALTGDVSLGDVFGDAGPAFAAANENHCGEYRPGVRLTRPTTPGFVTKIDTSDVDPLNLENRLDDRGMIYLRHGEPDFRILGPRGFSETWCYVYRGEVVRRVSFLRRTGGHAGTGDMVLTSMVAGEDDAARELLASDSREEPADLAFAFWLASFRDARQGITSVVILSDTIRALAALVDGEGREVVREQDSIGSVRLSVAPGSYLLMLDASRGRRANRYRGPITVPDYRRSLAISSLLLAPGNTAGNRDAMIAAVPRRLELPASRAMRVYAELYGLREDAGRFRYAVTYIFERLDRGGRPDPERDVTLRFDRDEPATSLRVETLVIDPDQLPSGRYRVRLTVRDLVSESSSSSGRIEFRLR